MENQICIFCNQLPKVRKDWFLVLAVSSVEVIKLPNLKFSEESPQVWTCAFSIESGDLSECSLKKILELP